MRTKIDEFTSCVRVVLTSGDANELFVVLLIRIVTQRSLVVNVFSRFFVAVITLKISFRGAVKILLIAGSS